MNAVVLDWWEPVRRFASLEKRRRLLLSNRRAISLSTCRYKAFSARSDRGTRAADCKVALRQCIAQRSCTVPDADDRA